MAGPGAGGDSVNNSYFQMRSIRFVVDSSVRGAPPFRRGSRSMALRTAPGRCGTPCFYRLLRCQGALCAVFLTPPHAARYLGLVALTFGLGYRGGGAPYNRGAEKGGKLHAAVQLPSALFFAGLYCASSPASSSRLSAAPPLSHWVRSTELPSVCTARRTPPDMAVQPPPLSSKATPARKTSM